MDKRVCTTNPDGSETWLTVCQAEDRIAELEAELAALKQTAQELQWENERLFVSLKGKGVRERLYHALKELDEMVEE